MRLRVSRSHLAAAPHYLAAGIGALTLLVTALILLVAVFARYVLNNPIAGVTELLGSGLMVMIVYLSLSSARHVRVSLIVNRLPELAHRVAAWIVVAITVATLGIAVYATYQGAVDSYRNGEATSGLVRFDIYPFRFLIVLGLLLTLIRVLEMRSDWLEPEQPEGPANDAALRGELLANPEGFRHQAIHRPPREGTDG